MKVVLTDEALADLQQIADDIAEDNPERAEPSSPSSSRRPARSGSDRSPTLSSLDTRTLGVRRRVHRAYLIFYRAEAERVTILHVLHGARDYEALLFGDE